MFNNGLWMLNILNGSKKVKEKKCENCKHRKTMKCPNSSLCYDTESKPYFKKKEGK